MLKPVVLLVTLLALDVFAKKKKKRRRGGMDALAAFTTAAKPPSRTGVPRRPLSLATAATVVIEFFFLAAESRFEFFLAA